MEAHAKAGLTKTYYGEHFTHGFHTLGTHPENTREIHRITQPNPYPWIFSDTNPTKPIHKKLVWVQILPLDTQISGTQSSPYYLPLDPIFKIPYNIRYSPITVAIVPRHNHKQSLQRAVVLVRPSSSQLMMPLQDYTIRIPI